MKKAGIVLCTAAVVVLSFSGRTLRGRGHPPPFLDSATPWADSVFQTLSLDQRIAQLMMVAAYSGVNKTIPTQAGLNKHQAEVERLITEKNIGGLIFFQGGPERQAAITNRFQALAKTPLLIGMDLEWGLAMRLDSTVRFPKQMTLGALKDDAGIEAMGREIARQMKRLGVQVSFSPVADVNNNPANPVINDRSFGEERELVARKAIAYMRGLQKGGVIATAKHFPGHGDTDMDSHESLPVIAQTRARLDSLELYPFERLMEEGLSAVMVAHLEVPALDSTPGLPSTLSKPVVTELLEKELGFRGLVFTDALNMKGVSKNAKPGEIELRALKAGNDVMLFPQDPIKAIERIHLAVDSGEVPVEMIDHKCLKVLRAKEWAGLAGKRFIDPKGITGDLNSNEARSLRRTLYRDAVTVLRNRNGLLPLRGLDSLRIASLVIGDSVGNGFQQSLSRYAAVRWFSCPKDLPRDSVPGVLRMLEPYDVVIASVHGTTFRMEKDFGIPDASFELLRAIDREHRLVMTLFSNPYRLTRAYGAQDFDGLVLTYEENDDAVDLAAQAIFGANGANGRLSVTPSSFFNSGDGQTLAPLGRLAYALPEGADVKSADLSAIDAIVREGINAKAFPGCEVLVAVDGQVVLNKAYGHPTYEAKRVVRTDDLYDLASVTKVAATTLAVMKLVDEGGIDLDKPLGHYMPELVGHYPAHAAMDLRDILTHQAGLQPFVPFYLRLLKDGRFKPGVIADSADATHTVRIAEGVYMKPAYQDSMWKWMLDAPLTPRGEYVYSDIDYYLLKEVVERVSGMSLDRFAEQEFYAPLGLSTMGFKPMERFAKERIMPTEYDVEFRHQQVQGDVHDPGAAMMGGVAGHAGLFSNANDLAILLQMLLNKGSYGGRRYLSEAVVTEFTKCQFCAPDGSLSGAKGNRRGLGFDKPTRDGVPGPTCDCVSYASFGHTGFTGTMIWADPTTKSLYVFLSNRVYPSAANKKLAEMNIRTRIQEVIVDAITARPTIVAPTAQSR